LNGCGQAEASYMKNRTKGHVKKNAPRFGKAGENSTIWDSPSPKFIMGGSDEERFDHRTQKPVELMRRPILNHTKRGELVTSRFWAAEGRWPQRN
jgi:DNA modification methylase